MGRNGSSEGRKTSIGWAYRLGQRRVVNRAATAIAVSVVGAGEWAGVILPGLWPAAPWRTCHSALFRNRLTRKAPVWDIGGKTGTAIRELLANSFSYVLLTTYSIAYGVQIGIERQTILNAVCLLLLLRDLRHYRLVPPLRHNRTPAGVIAGAVLIAVWGFALFPMLETKNGLIITIGMVIGQGVIHPMIYGPLGQASLGALRHRAPLHRCLAGLQIAGIGAGISPVLFAAILNSTGSPSTSPLSIVILIVAAISIFCIWRLGETEITDPVRTELRRDSSCHRHRMATDPTSSHGSLAAEGYTTIALNYTLGPEGTYPTAVNQINEALAYIDANADELNVDPLASSCSAR